MVEVANRGGVMKLVLAMVLVGLAVPRTAAAQAGEEETIAEQNVREPAPSAEPAVQKPCPKGNRGGAIAGIVVGSLYVPLLPMSIPVLVTQSKKLKAHNEAMSEGRCQYGPEQTVWQLDYTLDEMELRVKRAKIGLYVSAASFVAGVTMGFVALANYESCGFIIGLSPCPEYPDWVAPVGWTGFTLTMGGLAGILTSAVLLARRNHELRYGTPRRAQWDPVRSRLVF